MQATCTAVNELATASAANRTTITPFDIFELPIDFNSLLRSTLNKLAPDGGGEPPFPGVGSFTFDPQLIMLQPAHTAATPKPNLAKNSCLSIVILVGGFIFLIKIKYSGDGEPKAELPLSPFGFGIADVINFRDSLRVGKVDGEHMAAGLYFNTYPQTVVKARINTIVPEV